ncbi:MAG TPA: DMT family transporter [Candidatus Udaeobacter sp.]|jgi:drug/metabolite transporter (DMT)-like permease|nr:DMT family transporter [Candidatus Udaeobacter sp.]
MTLVTLALVLASAAIHASWNLWAKQIGHAAKSTTLMWTLTAISATLYAPFAIVMMIHGGWHPTPMVLGAIAGSGVIHIVYFLLLLAGYRAADLSLVYPVARGIGPLFSAIGAIALLGEGATAFSVAGALLIAAGVLILTWRSDLAHDVRLTAGLRYGIATGLVIATYTLWDGSAVKHLGVAPLVYYWGGELLRTLLLAPAALGDRAGIATLWREHRARVIGIAVLSPLSYILILIALRTGAVSHVAPAREVSILIGTFFGGHVLREAQRRRRIVAAAAFALGVIALAR